MTIYYFVISDDDRQNYKRFDHYLTDNIPDQSRSYIKNLFLRGKVRFNVNSPVKDQKIELKKMPSPKSIIEVEIPERNPEMEAQNVPLDVIHEDEHLCFINKQVDLVIHPAPGNPDKTLVNGLLFHYPQVKEVGSSQRPGIVHRLDKGTTGIMIFAKTQAAYLGLIQLFANHEINRVYEAIAMGVKMPPSGTLTSSIGRHPVHRQKMAVNVKGGRPAVTHYKVLKYYERFSHLEITLETGRTHQIRVHLSSLLKSPILCDPVYGNPKDHLKRIEGEKAALLRDYKHPLLHARTLGLKHPITGQYLEFSVEAPEIFQKILKEKS